MDQLITPFQNAFIRERNILDTILISHEIFDLMGKKKGRNNCFGSLKIDMSKAYDKVDQKFLKVVLVAMNFSPRWTGWIMECVSTIEYTLLVNGSMTQIFTPSKGLRQGDPISSYLFLMCANVLSIALLKAGKKKRIFKGLRWEEMVLLLLTYSLLMTPSYSSKKTPNLSSIYRIPSNGIVPYQGRVVILTNQIFSVLQHAQ